MNSPIYCIPEHVLFFTLLIGFVIVFVVGYGLGVSRK